MRTESRLRLASLVFLSLGVSLAFGACSDTSVNVQQTEVASVSVSPASMSMEIGESTQFTATVRDAEGNTLSDRTVSWSSSSTGVATITDAGLASCVGTGTTTITATVEGVSGTATLTVSEPPAAQTQLFPRWINEDKVLSNVQTPSGSIRVTLYGSPRTLEWSAILDDPLEGDEFAFTLWLGAGTSAGQTGTFEASVVIDNGSSERVVASTSFSVPYQSSFVRYHRAVTGTSGVGSPGDRIIFRVVMRNVSEGAVLSGADDLDTSILVSGDVTVH